MKENIKAKKLFELTERDAANIVAALSFWRDNVVKFSNWIALDKKLGNLEPFKDNMPMERAELNLLIDELMNPNPCERKIGVMMVDGEFYALEDADKIEGAALRMSLCGMKVEYSDNVEVFQGEGVAKLEEMLVKIKTGKMTIEKTGG